MKTNQKNNFTVEVRTKSGGEYRFANVDKIDYNFLQGTLIRIAKRTPDGKRNFKVFLKENVEAIDIVINKSSDSVGNNQPYYTNNESSLEDDNNNEENYDENNSDDIV